MPEIENLSQKIEQTAEFLVANSGSIVPEVGLVLGTGFGPVSEQIEAATYIPYKDVPNMSESTAVGHKGRFVIGRCSGKQVICMQGRLHGYEGNTSQGVAFPIWVMHKLGCKSVILTNAAGAINPDYTVGDICVIRDHINFTGRNPIAGKEPDSISMRFFSMLDCYDPGLRELAVEAAADLGIDGIREGIYLGLLGPSFETAAEIRAFRIWGADTVAMSICEEAIAARHVGMKVLGMSLCSNMACGVGNEDAREGAGTSLSNEIFEVANERIGDLSKLIVKILQRI